MTRADAAWLTFWVGFGLLDYAADRRGRSLSCTTRRMFCTDRPLGRIAFTAALSSGALVLHRHIIKDA